MKLYKIKIPRDGHGDLDPLVQCLVSQVFGAYEYWYNAVEDGYILHVYTNQPHVDMFKDAVRKLPKLDTSKFIFDCDREYPYKATELYRKLLDSMNVEVIKNPERGTIARFDCKCEFINQLAVSGDELNVAGEEPYKEQLARETFFYILKLCGLDDVDLQDLMMVRSR